MINCPPTRLFYIKRYNDEILSPSIWFVGFHIMLSDLCQSVLWTNRSYWQMLSPKAVKLELVNTSLHPESFHVLTSVCEIIGVDLFTCASTSFPSFFLFSFLWGCWTILIKTDLFYLWITSRKQGNMIPWLKEVWGCSLMPDISLRLNKQCIKRCVCKFLVQPKLFSYIRYRFQCFVGF